jgi:hypothetical protein
LVVILCFCSATHHLFSAFSALYDDNHDWREEE